jgi:hypothetical protein
MVIKMFAHLNLLTDFDIPEAKFHRFLHTLRHNYQHNPYHNFHHACDVMQMVFFMLVSTDLPSFLTKLDTLSLLLAALCHDVQHPGNTNAFEINTKTELSLLYNDISVLENHHCAHAFLLMRASENNILAQLSEAQFKELRYSMISSILNTDLSHHFSLLAKFTSSTKDKICSARTTSHPQNNTLLIAHTNTQENNNNNINNNNNNVVHNYGKTPLEKPDRQVLMDVVLHAADISNQVRPWETSKIWSDRLFTEFLKQGDSEKELGLSISPYMNRQNADQQKMSVNFIDFICNPLFTSVATAFPPISTCVENLRKNREKWATNLNVIIEHSTK